MKGLLAVTCASACILVAQPVVAAELGLSAETGLIFSDNVDRTPVGESVTVSATELRGQVIGLGRTYDVDVEAALIWHEFLDSDFDDELLPQLRGELNWAPAPENFVWTVRDNFGQVALSPAEALHPIDRQDINIFSTGPAVTFPVGQLADFRLGALFSDIYYEDDEFDNNRLATSATIEREISADRYAYLRVFSNRTEFKEQDLGAYDLVGYYVGYEGAGTRTGVIAELGIEELHDEGEVDDGIYALLDIEREMSEHSTGAVRYLKRTADAGDMFALAQDLEPRLGGTANILASSDPIALEIAMIDLRWEGARTDFGVIASWSDEDTDSTVQPDRRIYLVGLRGGRLLSDSARLGASVYFTEEDWTGAVEQKFDDLTTTVDLVIQIGAKTTLSAIYERYTRNNSLADYDENRFLILLRYSPRVISGALPSFYERRFNRRVGTSEPPDQS